MDAGRTGAYGPNVITLRFRPVLPPASLNFSTGYFLCAFLLPSKIALKPRPSELHPLTSFQMWRWRYRMAPMAACARFDWRRIKFFLAASAIRT